MKIDDKVYRVKDRDIIRVFIDGNIQGFYRSTGINSGMKDKWLPFDGILGIGDVPIWFIKSRYKSEIPKLNRYGTKELRDISFELDKLDIPQGEETSLFVINEWLLCNPNEYE